MMKNDGKSCLNVFCLGNLVSPIFNILSVFLSIYSICFRLIQMKELNCDQLSGIIFPLSIRYNLPTAFVKTTHQNEAEAYQSKSNSSGYIFQSSAITINKRAKLPIVFSLSNHAKFTAFQFLGKVEKLELIWFQMISMMSCT